MVHRIFRHFVLFFKSMAHTLASIRFTSYLAIMLAIGLTLFLIKTTEPSFWQAYLSNALATIVGILIGVPTTLYVTSRQEQVNEHERKKRVLKLLFEELKYNEYLIGRNLSTWDWQAMVICLQVDLKTETWEAFSDGGEIQWIKNPVLLGSIADAFFSLNNLRRWCDVGFHTYVNPLDGRPVLEGRIPNSLKQIEQATNKIKEELR